MIIRKEQEKDQNAVYEINVKAFETDAEAKLVDALRTVTDPYISLVAETDDKIVGHILFTPVTLSNHPELKIIGLAPMAVLPGHQNKGIGSELVIAGLEKCNQLRFGAVVVLGHPKYYPKFGFKPSVEFDIKSEYDVPDDVFMVMELEEDYLKNCAGIIKYHSVFNDL